MGGEKNGRGGRAAQKEEEEERRVDKMGCGISPNQGFSACALGDLGVAMSLAGVS